MLFDVGIAIGALIVIGVLWLRPWLDDYANPYD